MPRLRRPEGCARAAAGSAAVHQQRRPGERRRLAARLARRALALPAELDRARRLREALRALALANNVLPLDPEALSAVNDAAARLALELSADGQLGVRANGDELDRIVALAFGAMLDGSWERLKACRNCHWSFYDYSPNRSATWCSMQLCGNRKKTRAYRRRKATG